MSVTLKAPAIPDLAGPLEIQAQRRSRLWTATPSSSESDIESSGESYTGVLTYVEAAM